jgi:hypothetical protein
VIQSEETQTPGASARAKGNHKEEEEEGMEEECGESCKPALLQFAEQVSSRRRR